MLAADIKLAAAVLKDHYRLRGEVSRTEVLDEVRSLARKQAKGTLDDRCELLAARLHTATGRSVEELHKS